MVRTYVIERGQVEASAGTQCDAEILRVAIGGAEHPEQDAGAHEGGDILRRRVAALQELDDVAHLRPAVRLVFSGRRHGAGLANVFLRQAQQAAVMRPAAVEAFDDGAAVPEITDLGMGCRYADGGLSPRFR